MDTTAMAFARDPKDWQFQGSNDGSSWTTLDTRGNQSFATRFETQIFTISNPGAYRYYRLNVTANDGDGSTQLSELGLLTDVGRTIPDGTYRVLSRRSNKSLDVLNGGTADGTDAVQWGWNGGNSQKWTLTHLGNGTFKLLNVNSGKALDVNGGSTADGAAIIQWPYGGATNQQWLMSIAP